MQIKIEKRAWLVFIILVTGSIISLGMEAAFKKQSRTLIAGKWTEPKSAIISANAIAAPVFANLVVTNLNNNGTGSLRQAIVDAASGDTITFQAGLTGTITLASELVIAKNLTITGPGAATISISGNNAVTVFSITSGNVAISNLTITKGKTSAGVAILWGGCIDNAGGTLTLNSCSVTDGVADRWGGGIYNAATLTLNDCTVARGRASEYGGNVYNRGTLTINNGTITEGSAGLYGGGVYNNGSATATISNATISNNRADVRGGGIYSFGTINLNTSQVTDNAVTGNATYPEGKGGGAFLDGQVTVTDSTFTRNTAKGDGGGIELGEYVSSNVTANLTRCLVTNNSSTNEGGGIRVFASLASQLIFKQTTVANNTALSGGGLSMTGGSNTLENLTISGNTATNGNGGGVMVRAVTKLINSTVVNNQSTAPSPISPSGGGVTWFSGSLTLKNTIIADNLAPQKPDINFAAIDQSTFTYKPVNSQGGNLIGNSQGSSGGLIASDLLNVSPQLFPLGDYGGAVPTHLTKPGSPAINAGQDTTVAPDSLTIDARGIPRKLGSAVDIGAVENAQTLSFAPASLPAGTTGIAYSQTITAAGGNNFKIATGKLPLGLTLSASGVLSGTPIESGSFDITIAAADASGYRSAISYSLLINLVAPIAGRVNALSMPGYSANQQYVTFTEAQSPQVTGYPALTIEAWVKPTSTTGRYDILNRFPIFFNIQDGKPAFYLYGLANPGYYLATATLPAGLWSHIAVTWDGKKVQFYINGVSSGSTAVTGAIDNTVKLPLSLGYCIECGGGGGFLGQLDEIRLWKVARTQTEIQANQHVGLMGFESGLEAYWRFDETSGTTVTDATGHGFNGTINNLVTRVNGNSFVTSEDTPYNGTLFGYRKYLGPPLTYAIVTQGSKGTVSVNAATGAFIYTPNLNANGTDSFTFKVNNGLDSAPAIMSVIINPVDDYPVITPAPPFNLPQGTIANNVTIATVTDVDNNAPGSFVVTDDSALLPDLYPAYPGFTLTNIVNTNGVITATLTATCAAAVGTAKSLLKVQGKFPRWEPFTAVIVAGAPTVTAQPVSISRCEGAAATFSVTATNNNLSYQWRKNGTPISGATSSTYTIPAVASTDVGSYDVVITRVCGESVASTAATLSLNGTNAGTLGKYGVKSVLAKGSATITPDAVPAGASNGTVYTVSATGGFTGTLTVDAATGVVNVTNAQPVGTHTVAVTATTLCSNQITKTFDLTVLSPPVCATRNFSGTTEIPVGNSPYSIATGDFNSDGKLDFITANNTGASASLRLGTGTGNFSSPTDIGLSVNPSSIITGDFNNDTKLDFAFAGGNYYGSFVAVQLGDGNGNFSAAPYVRVDTGPKAITTGDFNNDGNLDLATVNYSPSNVSIRLGDGTGNFSGTTNVGVGSFPYAIAVGDFNKDGKLDFATANQIGRTVSIRLGDGAGNFSGTTEVSVSYSPQSIAVGDFNGDGNLDFATANWGLNGVSIRLGDGAGNFSGTTLVSVGLRPVAVTLGDFNNDGKLDFAAVNQDSNSISIRFGNGAGNFSGNTEANVGTTPYAIAVGDFNSDGNLDLATANSGSNAVSVRLNSCNTAPVITAVNGLALAQGTNANLTIAQVSDLETNANALAVTATSVPPGITLTNITNTNGIITATLNVAANATTGNQSIGLQVSDGAATANTTLALQITAASPALPTLITHPASQTVTVDNSVTFTVTGTNYTALQWQVSVNGGQFWTNIPNATSPTLTMLARSSNNGNRYRAVLSNGSGTVISNDAALTVTGSSTNAAATGLVIREFRLRGKASSLDPAQDEYIELYNLTTNNITVNNGGWAVAALSADGNSLSTLATIPNGTVIPSKGHYLLVNPNGYSLAARATGDRTFTTNIADDSGIAIFNSPSVFNTATLIDAAGFQSAGTQAALCREGTGLANLGANNAEYAWVRKMVNGQVTDTGDNANDFVLVNTAGTSINGASARLGTPSPDNRLGTVEMNSQIIQSLFDPLALSAVTPNQVRDLTPVLNGDYGTLTLRRTFTNHSGKVLSQLGFRLIDITNDPLGLEADLRLLNSVTATINGKVVEGLTIEPTPAQPNGGGLNSLMAIGSNLPIGATINIEFKLGVMRKGKYRFLLNIEAR